MSRIIRFEIEVNDQEFANFLTRMQERGQVVTGSADVESSVAATNPPDRDASGLPWDERIHAASKALNSDGTWRKRRGVDDATVDAVEAELRGATVEAPAAISTTPEDREPVAPPPAPPMLSLPMPTAPAAPPPVDYPLFAKTLNEAYTSGKLTADRLTEIYAKHNITDVNVLMTNETLRAAVYADVTG